VAPRPRRDELALAEYHLERTRRFFAEAEPRRAFYG
jgi:hypothetical protein